MKKKKGSLTFMALFLTASMLAGCGSSPAGGQASSGEASSSGDESGTRAAAGEEGTAEGYQTTYGSKMFDDVTISVELFDRSNAPEGSTILNNKWVEYVNEQMGKVGIHVEFVSVPRSDEVTKMQTLMSSGTAPDITITYTYSYAEDYFNQGGIWDLSEFIDGEGQAQNMKAYLGDSVIDIGRNTEGNLYGIVAKRATTANSNIFLRKDWLDDLGLEIPTTADEFYDVVTQMVRNNPDGKNGVVGMSFWGVNNGDNPRNCMSLAFSQLAGEPKEIDIAHGFDYYYDPGMREYFRYINKFYNEGFMDKEYYTMTTDTFNSDIVTGSMGGFESNVNYSVDVLRGSLLKTLQENDPDADIISIPALKNVNDGVQYSATYSEGGLIAFCPKTADAEIVEACMTYLDWQCTQEGGFVLYHGFEGEHYDFDDAGIPVVKDAAYNSADKDWIRTDIFLVGNQGYFETVDDFNACTSKEAPGYEDHVIENYENSMAGTCIPATFYTSPSTPDLQTDLALVRSEYMVQCITCPESEFDANYDAFMKASEDAGIKTIIEERTAYFTEVYGY